MSDETKQNVVSNQDEEEVLGLDEDNGPELVKLYIKDHPEVYTNVPKTHLVLSGMLKAAIENDEDLSEGIPLVNLGYDRVISRDGDGKNAEYLTDEEYLNSLPVTLNAIGAYLCKYGNLSEEDIKVPDVPISSNVLEEVCPTDFEVGLLKPLINPRLGLFHLTLASNYMAINPLLKTCVAVIASLIKGAELEKIERTLDPRYSDPVNE